jgi:hypothetical protein
MADVGVAMLSVSSGLNVFQSLLPKLSDVRKADPANNPDIAADVRMGEVAAGTMTLAVGIIASSLTKSPVPAAVALFTVIILVTIYESTLKAQRPFENRPNLRLVPEGSA